MPGLIRNQMANGKYSINSTLVVTCAAKCEHVRRAVQLIPGSVRRGFRDGLAIQGYPRWPRCGDAELSTWALGPGPGAKVLKSGWNINCCLCQLANWPSSHPANRQFPSTTSLLAARAARWPPRSWRRLELLVASG